MPGGRRQAHVGAAACRPLCRHPVSAKKSEFVRAFAKGVERLLPESLRLLVRATPVTRRPRHVAGTASMNDHRVVPGGETVREIACFPCADGIRHRSIQAHGHTHPLDRTACATRSMAIR